MPKASLSIEVFDVLQGDHNCNEMVNSVYDVAQQQLNAEFPVSVVSEDDKRRQLSGSEQDDLMREFARYLQEATPDLIKWAQWQSWVKIVDEDVTQIIMSRHIWWKLMEIRNDNPSDSPLRRHGGTFFKWVTAGYTTSQCVAVRRQNDKRLDVISLRRLLFEIHESADLVQMYGDSRVSMEEIESDLVALDGISNRLLRYVNKRVAHQDHKAFDDFPTFEELHAAIDTLESLVIRYLLVLYGSAPNELLPSFIPGWTEIFRHPWIVDSCSRQDNMPLGRK